MTVWEFMEKMGKYERFHIAINNESVTLFERVCVYDVKMHYEEREAVLDALELCATSVDLEKMIIYCEE